MLLVTMLLVTILPVFPIDTRGGVLLGHRYGDTEDHLVAVAAWGSERQSQSNGNRAPAVGHDIDYLGLRDSSDDSHQSGCQARSVVGVTHAY